MKVSFYVLGKKIFLLNFVWEILFENIQASEVLCSCAKKAFLQQRVSVDRSVGYLKLSGLYWYIRPCSYGDHVRATYNRNLVKVIQRTQRILCQFKRSCGVKQSPCTNTQIKSKSRHQVLTSMMTMISTVRVSCSKGS